MKKLFKCGLLASTILLSMVVLTSCSSKDNSTSTTQTPTGSNTTKEDTQDSGSNEEDDSLPNELQSLLEDDLTDDEQEKSPENDQEDLDSENESSENDKKPIDLEDSDLEILVFDVDSLDSLYLSLLADYAFPAMEQVADEFTDMLYPGLSDYDLTQKVMFIPSMSAIGLELAMVEVEDNADLEDIKSIFKTRIQSQIDEGAFYPETIEAWENNSQAVEKDNFVMLIVHPEASDIGEIFKTVL